MSAPLRMLFRVVGDNYEPWHIAAKDPPSGSHATLCGIAGFGRDVKLEYATNDGDLPEEPIHGVCLRVMATHYREPVPEQVLSAYAARCLSVSQLEGHQ